MIVYAVMAGGNVSIGGLFLAGVVPGLMIGFSIMGLISYLAYRRGYSLTGEPFTFRALWLQTKRSVIVFMMPVVVIGGIIGGVFTATEGAAVAVVYAAFIGFFVTRKLKISHLPAALLDAGIITGMVGALIVFSSVVTHLFTIELMAQRLADGLLGLTADPFVFLLLVMAVLIIVGMFMEANATYVMLAPLLAPLASTYGIDPIYFGFLFVLNITLGSITPPVGILLFVVAGIWQLPMTRLIANIWPFILVQYGVLALCLLFPAMIMFLPRAFGY
jgi:tripartite ATP-independent transporter DctM subunit